MGNSAPRGPSGAKDCLIDKGTMCATASPQPGVTGHIETDVEALKRSLPNRRIIALTPGDGLPDDIEDVFEHYVTELKAYLVYARPYWTSRLNILSGTLSNLEGGLTWLVAGVAWLGARAKGYGEIEDDLSDAMDQALLAGCIACQQQTFAVLRSYKSSDWPDGWEVRKWRIGLGMEHHAVLVHRKGSTPESGVMFDPWVMMEPEVYDYDEWCHHFRGLYALSPPREE